MRILAIDPGETCGVALVRFEQDMVYAPSIDGRDAYVPGLWQVDLIDSWAAPPSFVYDMLDRPLAHAGARDGYDAVICEEFRLYPWLAKQQGFSSFPTVEAIGVIKYLTAKKGFPLYMQRSDVKKEARYIAESVGWKMVERSLGSGRGKYRGPDFDIPGTQHPRDAVAHAVHWLYRNRISPLHSKDEHG